MNRCRTALAQLLLLACLAFPPDVSAAPVDRIVATVNDDVITASELGDTMELNLRLGRGGAAPGAAETLDGIVTRKLLVQEARRLRFVEVTSEDVAAKVEHTRSRFTTDAEFNAFLEKLDLTAAELGRLLEEQLLVERFVEKKIGLFVRVEREEAEAYFQSNPGKFAGRRFSDVQKAVTAYLAEQKIEQQLDRYVADLRSKADIRIPAP